MKRHLSPTTLVGGAALLFFVASRAFVDDSGAADSISRIWKDYELNNLIQSEHEMSIHVNRSESGNSTSWCSFKHSRAFNASKVTRPAIIFAFYQEIRSFHITVRVLKERIIDQLRTVYGIKLAVFFRHAHDNHVMNDMRSALQALSELAALEDVHVVKVSCSHWIWVCALTPLHYFPLFPPSPSPSISSDQHKDRRATRHTPPQQRYPQ